MKILLINTFERNGGAAIACLRLMKALQKAGVSVKLIVRDKVSDDPNVVSANISFVKKKISFLRFCWERLVIFINNGFNRKNLFETSIANTGTDISNLPEVNEADIIHLHWTNQGFLSLKDIEKLIKIGKPIVWTMHDMWSYTGICHYSYNCNKFTTECKECPFLNSKNTDLSTKIFRAKNKLFKHASLVFVGCSQWIANGARKSRILSSSNYTVSIPNPIDLTQYIAIDRQEARKHFNFPINKKLILFGSAKVTDKRKGVDYMIEACKLLIERYPTIKDDVEIVTFGKNTDSIQQAMPFTVHSMNYISSVSDMLALYNSVNIYIHPSLEDNLPNTIMEAMACAVPCVGFDIGGIPEMIDHKETGFLAKYKSADDLAKGIYWTLFEADDETLSKNARQKAISLYSEEIVTQQYIKLYTQCLEQSKYAN